MKINYLEYFFARYAAWEPEITHNRHIYEQKFRNPKPEAKLIILYILENTSTVGVLKIRF